MYMYVYIHAYKFKSIYIYTICIMCICIDMYTHSVYLYDIYIHTYIHMYIHAYTYVYIYIHMHIHVYIHSAYAHPVASVKQMCKLIFTTQFVTVHSRTVTQFVTVHSRWDKGVWVQLVYATHFFLVWLTERAIGVCVLSSIFLMRYMFMIECLCV